MVKKSTDSNRRHLTKQAIAALPLPTSGAKARYFDTKEPGLTVMVSSKGARVYYFFKRINGKLHEIKLGSCLDLSLEQARAKAAELRAQIAAGQDPMDARRKGRSEPTFGDLFDWYLAEGKPDLKPSTRQTYLGLYTRYLSDFGKRKASEITKADVRELKRLITMEGSNPKGSKGAPYGANRMLALVRAVYNAASRWDLYNGPNPAEGIERNREEKREARLFPEQIAGLFQALDNYPSEPMRDLFALCLLTGQRVGSVKSMAWADVRLKDHIWVIPDTKNNRPQNVPLLDDEVEILNRRKLAADKSPWVFPANSASGHLESPNKAWEEILELAGLPKKALRIHDLRRSLGSFMVDSGASLPIIGKTLGHMSPSTTAIYARLSMDPIKEAKMKAHAALAAARKDIASDS
jgi:integrase